MNRNKIVTLVVLLIVVLIGLRSLDLKLRYNMSWSDYYRYSGGLTIREKTLLKEDTLLAGIYNDPPLSFINEFNNHNAGIMVDYVSQLAIELSSDIYLKASSKDKVLTSLERSEIDIAVIERTDDSEDAYLLSQSLCTIRGRIAVKNNSGIEGINDLDERTLVTLKKDNINGQVDDFFKDRISIHIIEVENMYQCFALIRNNIAIGYVGDDMEVAHFLNVTNKGSSYKFLEPILYENEICLAVDKANEELMVILNKGILNLKRKNLITQTQRKWLGDFDSHGIDLWQLDWAYKVVTGVMAIVVFFSSWNYIITQRVNIKTRELSESKAELRLIIDTLKSGIMVIENNEKIVECNDGVTHLLGMKRESLIDSNYNEIETLKPFVEDEHMNQLFNLGDKYYYITSQPFGSSKKLIMIEDYTDKHITEQRARQESNSS